MNDKITIEELQRLFTTKQKELNEKEFDLFVGKFWETKEKEIKERIGFNKLKLENIKENINLIDIQIIALKLEKQKQKEKAKELRELNKELKRTLK